jgi:anti-sigma regulatory factor (Ser/Thr protein kinase)
LDNNNHSEHFSFRPKARLLVLLGDQLIGSARLALFELVKNSYDADASIVTVELCDLDKEEPYIVIRDDGIGMSFEDIRDIWLVPGADHKLIAKQQLQRSPTFGRLPLGEKGLGRFAVHKLGEHILLASKQAGADHESVVQIDWQSLVSHEFLSDARVEVIKQPPEYFPDNKHGTAVVIANLRDKKWTRGDIRRAFRQVTSICSPFKGPKDFKVEFKVPGRESDLAGIPSYEEILDRALWRFEFTIQEDGEFSWEYAFENKLKGVPIENRQSSNKGTRLLVRTPTRDLLGDSSISKDQRIMVDADYLKGIGCIRGEFYVFDRDKELLARMPETQLIKLFLDESSGIRVYRDGVRVYNYGERGDDWLGLDLRRVNVPASRISNNIAVGAIHITQEGSTKLVEKTNREGFVDSSYLDHLKTAVLGAISVFEIERRQDKDRLRRLLKTDKPEPTFTISTEISNLRSLASQNGVLEIFEPTIKRIETEYQSFQETMLHAGLSGLGLAVVFHEVERGIRGFHNGLEAGLPAEDLKNQAAALTKLFDGFAGLLRKNEREPIKMSDLVKQARDINILRFRFHKVDLVCPMLEGREQDYKIEVSRSLMLGVLNNIFDNAFFWLRTRYPEVNGQAPSHVRKLYISTFEADKGSVGIAIADNGPGFVDPPSTLVQPFVTRKPDGMGLGLYYTNLVMELSQGSLQFPNADEVGLPAEATGAVIALTFKSGEKVK